MRCAIAIRQREGRRATRGIAERAVARGEAPQAVRIADRAERVRDAVVALRERGAPGRMQHAGAIERGGHRISFGNAAYPVTAVTGLPGWIGHVSCSRA